MTSLSLLAGRIVALPNSAVGLLNKNEHYDQFHKTSTVNSEIFAGVLIRESSHMRSLVKIKPSRNGLRTLSFTSKSYLNAIRENKIHVKISEFTVP